MVHRFSHLVWGFKLIYQSPASSLTFKVLRPLYSQFGLEFKHSRSTWRPLLLLCILLKSYITSQPCLCPWTLEYQRGCIWLDAEPGAPKYLSSKNEAVAADFLWWTCKEEGMGKGVLHLSGRFFQIRSTFFVVKCCGKLDGLAKQRWMFSPKQSVDGPHSRGKLCKSLHWFGAKPSWPLKYISRLAMEAMCIQLS